MKTKIIFLCAVLLMAQAAIYGQKTQVSVQEGKVKARTVTDEVIVDAGKKVILTSDKEPVLIVDDPLVEDIMEIYKWVEAEKKAQREKIDTSFILVSKIDDENLFRVAYFLETQNPESELTNIYQFVPSAILEEPKFYDMQGNLLKFELKKENDKRGRYSIVFSKPVEPGDKFKYICVGTVSDDELCRKEGPLRLFTDMFSVPNQLNYYRVILPESAVFVDSSRPVTIVDSHNGRIAVTIRNYTGLIGDGAIKIAFLWPAKDGTTLMNLPPQYRGLRDQRQEEIVREYRLVIAKILAGETYDDQSTPLKTLRTFISAVIHKDKELFLGLIDESMRQIASQQYDQFVGEYGSIVLDFEFLDTPQWPEKPENGTTHPVYMCRKGSLLRAVTITMVYHDGKWYWQNANADG